MTSWSEQVFEISNTLKDIVNKIKCKKSDKGDAMKKTQSNKEDDDKSKKIATLEKTTTKPKAKKKKKKNKLHNDQF